METQYNPIEVRKQRGLVIAQTSRIVQDEKGRWKVPSQSGAGFYFVKSRGDNTSCNCKDHKERGCKCKHIWAVEFIVTHEVDKQGNVTITATKKVTYAQDWHNYNLAQTKEKELFMKLLADLTSKIQERPYTFGKPKNSLRDTIYSMIFKVYSTFSSRRFTSDMEQAKSSNFIESITPRSSMSDYFNKEELTDLLSQLVTITALPLKEIDRKFAIDSTGFGTSNFQRWYSFKHGKAISSRKWVKCHFITGTITNGITSVKITSEFDNDCPQLKQLYQTAKEFFDMQELSADKAYLSRDNLELIENSGTKAFIPFKINSTPSRKGGIWKRLYHYFALHNEEFLQSYHQRSNAETSVYMIKSKFGDSVRSKKWNAQVNEVLCKVICHNICCVIMEMFCRGIKPDFIVEMEAKI
ncbi:MAG: transposase [Nanoarchaeota archaeon]